MLYQNKPGWGGQICASGYRGPEPVKPVIVCIGGSTTYGHTVADYHDSWPWQLGQQLGVETVNAGLPVVHLCRVALGVRTPLPIPACQDPGHSLRVQRRDRVSVSRLQPRIHALPTPGRKTESATGRIRSAGAFGVGQTDLRKMDEHRDRRSIVDSGNAVVLPSGRSHTFPRSNPRACRLRTQPGLPREVRSRRWGAGCAFQDSSSHHGRVQAGGARTPSDPHPGAAQGGYAENQRHHGPDRSEVLDPSDRAAEDSRALLLRLRPHESRG